MSKLDFASQNLDVAQQLAAIDVCRRHPHGRGYVGGRGRAVGADVITDHAEVVGRVVSYVSARIPLTDRLIPVRVRVRVRVRVSEI